MCTSRPLGVRCFQWLLWWDLSSVEAFGLSHVSLEEQEKQVCSSWPGNRPCTGRQESWISWAVQCCHLLPAGGCLCVQGTSLCPGDTAGALGEGASRSTGTGRGEQTHPGTHLPQNVCSLQDVVQKRPPATSNWFFSSWRFLIWIL